MIKAVIFDNDGTILDSEEIHHSIERQIVEKYGKKIPEELIDELRGRTENVFWKTICKELGLEIDWQELKKQKAEIYIKKLEELRLFSGAKELIKSLKEKGIKVAVASSTQKEWLNKILKIHRLDFDVVISGEFIEKSKPEPDIYLVAAEKLDLKPEECLAIEDTVSGVEAVKRAGMKCVAVTHTFSKDKLKEADYIISNLKEFKYEWLE